MDVSTTATIRRWHPSIDDPRPHFPRRCPVCGGVLDVYHLTEPLIDGDEAGAVWYWYAVCGQGHRIDPPVQTRLALEDVP